MSKIIGEYNEKELGKYQINCSQKIEFLLGKIIKGIKIYDFDTEISFCLEDGSLFNFYHSQECCEMVFIKSIDGDLENLLNKPLVMAECVIETQYEEFNSSTWTFYKFATINGYVTIAWEGTSNGYYSEEVDCILYMP